MLAPTMGISLALAAVVGCVLLWVGLMGIVFAIAAAAGCGLVCVCAGAELRVFLDGGASEADLGVALITPLFEAEGGTKFPEGGWNLPVAVLPRGEARVAFFFLFVRGWLLSGASARC